MLSPPEGVTYRCYYAAAEMLTRLRSLLPLEDLAVGARFLWDLPPFLRRPVSEAEARAILARRFERREADFLALLGRAVFGQPEQPTRQLLALAGCEAGDLARLVRQE